MTPAPFYCQRHQRHATWTDAEGRQHCPDCDREQFTARFRHLILAPIYKQVAGRKPSWARP